MSSPLSSMASPAAPHNKHATPSRHTPASTGASGGGTSDAMLLQLVAGATCQAQWPPDVEGLGRRART